MDVKYWLKLVIWIMRSILKIILVIFMVVCEVGNIFFLSCNNPWYSCT